MRSPRRYGCPLCAEWDMHVLPYLSSRLATDSVRSVPDTI